MIKYFDFENILSVKYPYDLFSHDISKIKKEYHDLKISISTLCKDEQMRDKVAFHVDKLYVKAINELESSYIQGSVLYARNVLGDIYEMPFDSNKTIITDIVSIFVSVDRVAFIFKSHSDKLYNVTKAMFQNEKLLLKSGKKATKLESQLSDILVYNSLLEDGTHLLVVKKHSNKYTYSADFIEYLKENIGVDHSVLVRSKSA